MTLPLRQRGACKNKFSCGQCAFLVVNTAYFAVRIGKFSGATEGRPKLD